MKNISKNLPKIVIEIIEIVHQKRQQNPFYTWLFIAISLNLIIAPAIYAATGEDLTHKATYALGLLTVVTLALSIYLFVVIFQPERF